jgi:ABC-type sugar transport system ATPase subunit
VSQGEEFLLWFDALKDKRSRHNTLNSLLASDMNVESTSYMPLFLYQNDMWDKAYQKLLFLSSPTTARRMYPEVSFGVIEGIVQGLMGVEADARSQTITTLYRSTKNGSASLKKVPVLGTTISITHQNAKSSIVQNNGNKYFI